MVGGNSRAGRKPCRLRQKGGGGGEGRGRRFLSSRLGRAELLMPLRVNRVEDLWRAASLREGQLFTVRRGTVKRGEKHPGRRAPELPYLMRMYLPFVLLEFEFELSTLEKAGLDSKGSGQQPKALLPRRLPMASLCFFHGMSIVIEEKCIIPEGSAQGSGDSTETRVLLHPKGQTCTKSSRYFRAFMYVRHVDMDQTPVRMFDKMRRSFQRSMSVPEGGWMEGRKMHTWLTPCFGTALRRMRMVRCIPVRRSSARWALPVGAVPGRGAAPGVVMAAPEHTNGTSAAAPAWSVQGCHLGAPMDHIPHGTY